MRISDALISEICDKNDIIDIISQYVTLKKTGRDYSGLCPFHNEKSPSFHVSREKQLFHCFGCGASGNMVQFVMRSESLDFVEALKLLADRAGIIIPENDGYTDSKEHERRQRILQMNKISARFFYDMLKDENIGREAREYFRKRRISTKTITAYGLGYAPKSGLYEFLRTKGYSDTHILDAGLAIQRDGKMMDKFRNRVMFPIIDVRGNVIAFGGRTMLNVKEINGYKIPKYLNSSETAVFDKGANLFSLNLAKNAKSTELILCEGYMDVISVYQAGIKNIVATLGTAITEKQAKLMMRYANEIVICYDSDEAGIKAAQRAIDIINKAGGKSRVIRLKGAKDPDEYINKHGAEGFKNAVRDAVPSTEFRISQIKKKFDTSTTDGKVRFVSEAAHVLSEIGDAIEADAYIKRISEETEISKEAIYSEVNKKNSTDSYIKIPVKREIKRRENSGGENVSSNLKEAEKRVLSLISQSRKLYKKVKKEMGESDFSTDVYRRLAKKIYECYENGETPDESLMLNEFSSSNAEMNEASAVFYNMEIYDGDEETVDDLIYTIKLEKLNLKIDTETDIEKLNKLLIEKRRLEEDKTWEE